MPSLRTRLRNTVKKWRAMLKSSKRRGPPGEEEQSQGSQQPKHPRTGEDANSNGLPNSHTLASLSTGGSSILIASTMQTAQALNTSIQPTPGSAMNPIDLTASPALLGQEQTDQVPSSLLLTEAWQPQTLQGQPRQDTQAPIPVTVQRDELAEYRLQLQAVRCAGCLAAVTIKLPQIRQLMKTMLDKSCFLHPCIHCPKCNGWFCVGGETYHPTKVPSLKCLISTKNFKITWCCNRARLFLIFALLCGCESPAQSPARPKKPPTNAEPVMNAALADELSVFAGNGKSQLSKGTGYGSGVRGMGSRSYSTVSKKKKAVQTRASMLERYLIALSRVLPSAVDEPTATFDSAFQEAVSAMMARSPMLHHAADLLRHASLEEIDTLCDPVSAILDIVENIGNHVATAAVLLRERVLLAPEEQLGAVVLPTSGRRNAAASTQRDTAQSLASIVEQLAVPCRKFVEATSRLGNVHDDQGPLVVVQRIGNIADWLRSLREQLGIWEIRNQSQEAAQPKPGLIPNVTTRSMKANAAKASASEELQECARKATEWHRANCVKELPDEVIMRDFHFTKEATRSGSSEPSLGRMRKLLAQVSSLSTDLPEGIYVRHGESRVDVLRIIIVGPADTPYENGLFEFDMFCHGQFPCEPPMVFFKTTGHGRATFNPNLYPNGKVCLSLLGTWSGQPWEPNRSTILQVLVSIQAMILIKEPYYNEPGHEFHLDDTRSRDYNRHVEQTTVQYAMLPWLTERLTGPEAPQTEYSISPHASTAPLTIAGPSTTPALPPFGPITVAGPSTTPATQSVALSPDLTASWYDPPPGAIPILDHPLGDPGIESFLDYAPLDPSTINNNNNNNNNTNNLLTATHPTTPSSLIQAAKTKLLPAYAKAITKQPPQEDDPIWGDVVRRHFELNAAGIMQMLHQWTLSRGDKDRAPRRDFHRPLGLGEGMAQVKGELERHGFLERQGGSVD